MPQVHQGLLSSYWFLMSRGPAPLWQPLYPEAQLARILLSALVGARTSVVTGSTGSSSSRTMHDSEFQASVVGSNFRPLFHSSLCLSQNSTRAWGPAGQDGEQEGVGQVRGERQD